MNSIFLMQNDLSQEIEYAKNLFNNTYLSGLGICSCNSTNFKIYKDSQYKINQKYLLGVPIINVEKNKIILFIINFQSKNKNEI